MKILMLMSGGAIGTLLRYFTYELTKREGVSLNYWGTFTVNIVGAFVIGLLWGMLDIKSLNPHLKSFLFVGLLGGFTTFSTFALDVMSHTNSGNFKTAAFYLLGSNAMALILVFMGFFIGKYLSL
jgi:CrcB protein